MTAVKDQRNSKFFFYHWIGNLLKNKVFPLQILLPFHMLCINADLPGFLLFFFFKFTRSSSYFPLFSICTKFHGNGWIQVPFPWICLDSCLEDSSSKLILFGSHSIFQAKVSLLCSFFEPTRACETATVLCWTGANKPHVSAGFVLSEGFYSPLMRPQPLTSQQEGTRKRISLWAWRRSCWILLNNTQADVVSLPRD